MKPSRYLLITLVMMTAAFGFGGCLSDDDEAAKPVAGSGNEPPAGDQTPAPAPPAAPTYPPGFSFAEPDTGDAAALPLRSGSFVVTRARAGGGNVARQLQSQSFILKGGAP
ncbi:MAG: hypothetical protein A2583_04470 [Bdellovibrionales bacterium RIFOXYD1_FULL_53_11]|nr:MAG: hypothetical protein A2583_04470 [Bdellovibrionales bacterium RIFOXYD1_FULL_53_11]